MAVTRRKTDEVLAAARKDLQAQLAVVRGEMSRLADEDRALTEALSSLDGDSPPSPPAARATRQGGRSGTAKASVRRSSGRRAAGSRRRRPRGASKSTAERVEQLQGLLGDGPKSRNDLAAALKVSPARVQQLLAELGSSVGSEPDPKQRQGKLWSLKAGSNGASAAKPAPKRDAATAGSTRKPTAPKAPASK